MGAQMEKKRKITWRLGLCGIDRDDYQHVGPTFLVQSCYWLPPVDLKIIFVIMLAPAVGWLLRSCKPQP